MILKCPFQAIPSRSGIGLAGFVREVLPLSQTGGGNNHLAETGSCSLEKKFAEVIPKNINGLMLCGSKKGFVPFDSSPR